MNRIQFGYGARWMASDPAPVSLRKPVSLVNQVRVLIRAVRLTFGSFGTDNAFETLAFERLNDVVQNAPDRRTCAEALALLTPRELFAVADLNHVEASLGRVRTAELVLDARWPSER